MQKVFGFCAAKTGTQIDESMQARENGHERMLGRILTLEEGMGSCSKMREDGTLKGKKEGPPGGECKRLREEFCGGRFHGAERNMEHGQKETAP